MASDLGDVCFDAGALFRCTGTAPIGHLAPGEIKLITLSFSKHLSLFGNILGTVKIRSGSVSPKELSVLNNEITIVSSRLTKAGGVDMTFAEMSGIQIDPASGQIRFILKGTEAKAGDAVIDLNATTANLNKIFLQALAIPNSKHYISLDVAPDANGNLY